MGQKVNPHGLRVGVIKDWDSRWFAGKATFGDTLVEDYKIRGNDMNVSVQNLLNTEPLTIKQNDDLFKAAFLMHANETDYMIVLSQNSKIVGILYHSGILACNY